MKDCIKTKHGDIKLPAFMPDATYGSVKMISFEDVRKTGTTEIVTTTLHIEQKIGASFIEEFGGIHKFFGWERPILTDSGGWQVFSLINSGKGDKRNKISEVGCSFINPENGKFSLLTPETSIIIQSKLAPDIMTVLDNPILGNASLNERKKSIHINTKWAQRAQNQFKQIYSSRAEAPLLGCVVQGGDDFKLRKQSVEELLELDFDLYNYGGVPLISKITWKHDHPIGFYKEMLQFVSDLIPPNKIKYAMGVGQPEDIAFCYEVGWDLFDTVLPTRNARHGYLYVSQGNGDATRSYKDLYYDIQHIKTERYKYDQNPIDNNCHCEACMHFSRAYIRHLLKIKEPAGMRLCTIHNLTFYSNWMNEVRKLTRN